MGMCALGSGMTSIVSIASETSARPPREITSARVLALFAYWEKVRARRMAPRWAEIQPGDIKPLLPYIIVGQVRSNPFDVQFRIVGTAVVEAFGFDFTWETLRSPLPESDASSWLGYYRCFVDRRAPSFGQYRMPIGLTETRRVDVGIFPLSSNGTSVDRLIELEDWETAEGFLPRVSSPTALQFATFPAPAG
jgi:hypothetical protein